MVPYEKPNYRYITYNAWDLAIPGFEGDAGWNMVILERPTNIGSFLAFQVPKLNEEAYGPCRSAKLATLVFELLGLSLDRFHALELEKTEFKGLESKATRLPFFYRGEVATLVGTSPRNLETGPYLTLLEEIRHRAHIPEKTCYCCYKSKA